MYLDILLVWLVKYLKKTIIFFLYLFREKSWFTHGGVCTRSNVEYAVTNLQNSKAGIIQTQTGEFILNPFSYLKRVGGQLGA